MNERPQKPYKVVFMGSPDFSVPCLKALYESPDFEVKAVYSMPDKPKGRGKQLSPTPVKAFAIEHNITVRTPASFNKEPEEIEVLRSFEPDYLVVVAYGLILSQKVLDIPRIAAVNLHASLLPSFRGSSPMQYAILNGLKETGNTVMLMSKGMDEGDMLATNKISIEENDDLQDCVVTALKICIVCSVLQLLINYIPSIFNWVSTFAKLASINVKTSNLDNVCRAIGQIIVFIGNIKLILFGLKQGN